MAMTTDKRQLPEGVSLTFEYIRTDIREAVGNVGGQLDRLLNLVEQLRAQVIGLRLGEGDGWQDIASAPKDVEVEVRGIWQTRGGGVQFTHWRPLPAPPVIAEERADG